VSSLQKAAQLPLPASLGLTPEEQVYVIDSSNTDWQRIKSALVAPHGTQLRKADATPRSADNKENDQSNVRPGLDERIVSKLKHHLSDPTIIEKARQVYRASTAVPDRNLLFLAVSVDPGSWAQMSVVIEQATGRMLKLGPLFPGIPPEDWAR